MKIQMWFAIGSILIGAALVQGCEKKEAPSGGDGAQQVEPAATQESGSLQPAAESTPAQPAMAAADENVDLTILNWAPKSTKAGVPFRATPDGQSVIGFDLKKVGPNLTVFFNNTELKSVAINRDANGVTAYVPNELFASAGNYEVYIMDKATGKKSDVLTFKVD